MNELEKRVRIRFYENKVIYGPDQTFEEWMDSFEKTLMDYHFDHWAITHLYYEKHTNAFNQLKKIYQSHPVLEMFHKNMFEEMFREIENENLKMRPPVGYEKNGGSYSIPAIVAQFIIWGMEISKRETKGYELFRIYYHHALNNDFNLPVRAKDQSDKINFNPFGDTFNPDVWKFDYGFYQNFPGVPPKKQQSTDWARALKQTLKGIIKREEIIQNKGLIKRK